MSILHLLEDFSDHIAGTPVAVTDVMLEDQKLAAFEKGYQAGWDDSAASQKDSKTRISEDFAQNVRDLSFTYQEAYSGLLGAMHPLISQMVNAVLPVVAQETLGVRIAELLQQHVAAHGQREVSIVTASPNIEGLRAILPQTDTLPIDISEDATLSEGQVHIRVGADWEQEIDLAEVLEGIRAAVDGFFQEASNALKETA